MNQLVAFRVVQGMGAGGLFALAHATIGVIVPPRERGRYQGLFGSTFVLGSIVGPAARRDLRRPGELALGVLRQRAGRADRDDRDRDRDPEADGAPRSLPRPSRRGAARRGHVLAPARRSSGAATTAGARRRVLGAFAVAVVLLDRLRLRRAARARADPALRPAAEPDGRDRGRVHRSRRDGVRRDDRLRPALRPGRDRHLGNRVRRRPDAVHGRGGHDERALGPVGLAHRALPAERARGPGRARCRAASCSPGWTRRPRTRRPRPTWR